MGEDPKQIPNNQMSYASQVAVGKLEKVHVFGTDYETHDETGVYDYIHAMDLDEDHIATLKKLNSKCGFQVYDHGSGTGYSVLEMASTMSNACEYFISYINDKRCPGDLANAICDPSRS